MSKKWRLILILSLLFNLFIIYVAYKALDYRSHVNFYLHKYIDAVNEMARLDVYETMNPALQSDTTVDNRIVFFGTQVIHGWDVRRDFPEYEAINRGVDGQRAAGLILRMRADVINLSPEAVLIQISSYNFRAQNKSDDILNYTRELLDMAACHHIYPIAATVITPSKEILDTDEEIIASDYIIHDTIKAFNARLREYCRYKDIALADFDSILSGDDGYMRGNLAETSIAPDDSGYILMAQTVKPLLANMKKR